MFSKTIFRFSLFIILILNSFSSFSQEYSSSKKRDQLFEKWSASKYQNTNNVLHLSCPPIDSVRIAVIGLGN